MLAGRSERSPHETRPVRVGLFIPCYVDQFYPHVGAAAVRVLRRFGRGELTLEYPTGQVCCGQPMANAGLPHESKPLAETFLRTFAGFDAVVCPSGSCTSMVRNHYGAFLDGRPGYAELQAKTYEFCEFLTDVLKVGSPAGRFPHVVGLHPGCHGLRELRLGSGSERNVEPFDKVKSLLTGLEGITFSEPNRPDECCGFGGTFAVAEEAVSVMMGQDKVADHKQAGTEVLASPDMSCLMHLEGVLRRGGDESTRVMHVAEVLEEATRGPAGAG